MTEKAPAKKAAARKRTPAKKATVKSGSAVDIVLTSASRGLAVGDVVQVDEATADRLVAQGHARRA